MEDDESLPVVKQVLDSLNTYLCHNLPNEEAFIIQLGNAGLISKDKAPWLGVLARNKDPSCISNLIESMRDYFDESMLSNFCTFLDKYAKDARPQMRIVATKIRTKIGKANELKDPGSKRSQTPSVDHQPPPKKSHSAQEGQIKSIVDLLPFLKSMLPHLGLLGPALGIPLYARAVIDRPGSNLSKCQDILQNWLDCTPAVTWDLLLEKLISSKVPSFNSLIAKIQEAQQSDSEGSHSMDRAAASDPEEPKKEQDKELPHEDSASNSWEEQYKKVINERCVVKVDITRCVLIGPARVGKSSLKQLLVHNEPRPVHESTDLMEAPVVLASMYHESEESRWQLLTVDNLKQMLKKSTAEGGYDSPSDATVQESHQDSGSIQSSGTDHSSELPSFVPKKDDCLSDLKSELSRFVKGLESVGDTDLKMNGLKLIHLFDCGGQLAFQDAIPCLIHAPCAFIAVFDASVDLKEVKEWTYCPHKGSEELGRGHKESQWNILLRIFSSIHSLQCKCHDDLKKLTGKDERSYSWPIAVVGTHKAVLKQDKVNGTIINESIKSHFADMKKSKPYSFLQTVPPDLVENTTVPMDDTCKKTINKLRDKILKKAYFSTDLPLTWLFLELFTRSQHPNLLFISYEDLRTLCNDEMITNSDEEFKSLLRVLHALGFYAFYPLKDLGVPEDQNWVCTDAATLYKEVSRLLMVQYTVDTPETDATKYLKDVGKIALNDVSLRELFDELKIGKSNDEIDRVFSPRWLILVLVYIGLAAKFKRGGIEQVFIPLVLPFKGYDLPPVTERSVATLFITLEFPSGPSMGSVTPILTDLPCGIFPRLVVLLLSEESKCPFEIFAEDSDRACVKLMPSESESDYHLYLKNSINCIEAALQVNETDTEDSYEAAEKVYKICKFIRQTLTSSLEDAFLKLFGNQPVTARCGFKCICKKSSQNDHLAVNMMRESQSFTCVLKQGNYRLQSRSWRPSQRIWFCPVEAKFSLHDERDIWVMADPSSSARKRSPADTPSSDSKRQRSNSDPILISTPIQSDVLLYLRPRLSAQWKNFSICLQFQHNQQDCIAEDNHYKADNCFMAVITRWLRKRSGTGDLPRTWGTLLKVVCDLENSDIADEVHRALAAASTGVPLSQPTPPLQPRPLQQQEEQEKEKEGEVEEHRSGDEQDARGVVKFALITANDNEWESAKFFMGAPMENCKISDFLLEYLPGHFNFSELFQTDGTSVELTGEIFKTYCFVRVCGVLGVLTKCTKMGSYKDGAAGHTVAKLLNTAREEKWELKAVFLVGCCGCASAPKENVNLGAVLIANPILLYAGKVTKEGLDRQGVQNTCDTDQSWVGAFTIRNSMPGIAKKLKVQNLKGAPFLSGDFLMKGGVMAENLRKKNLFPLLGFEMEGAGADNVIKFMSLLKMFPSDQKPPAILVVKGVCDSANSKKNVCADTAFFKETIPKVDKDSRQQMCTMMSLMVVFRAIKAEMADGAT